jgi:hypothetical protein
MVVIVLTAFNQLVTPTAATVKDTPVDAIAEFEIDLEHFADMFQIQGMENLGNNTDSEDTPLKYYVNSTPHSALKPRTLTTWEWPFNAFNPAFALVKKNAATTVDGLGETLEAKDMTIVSDYIRSLSFNMFGSPQLSYLITNDFTVQKDVVSKLKTSMGDVKAKVDLLDRHTGLFSGITTGADGFKYLTNSSASTDNICRELFLGLLKQAPERFAESSSYLSDEKYTLPFREGDRLTFKVTLDNSAQYGVVTTAPTGQTTGTVGWAAAGQIPNRIYTIVLVLKSSPSAAPTLLTDRFTLPESGSGATLVPAFSPFPV